MCFYEDHQLTVAILDFLQLFLTVLPNPLTYTLPDQLLSALVDL